MLYDLATFQALVNSSSWGYLNERRPFATREKYGWTDDDIAAILCGLTVEDFQKTAPNCEVTSAFEGCDFVDADQYRIYWDDSEKQRRSNWGMETIELSLKIAIVTDSEGELAGLVTIHTSGM